MKNDGGDGDDNDDETEMDGSLIAYRKVTLSRQGLRELQLNHESISLNSHSDAVQKLHSIQNTRRELLSNDLTVSHVTSKSLESPPAKFRRFLDSGIRLCLHW